MAENKIELKSVNDLLGMNFYIPSYQRGYRWTTLHVEALLEDLDNFLKHSEEPGAKNEAYCLQPIVVVGQQDSNEKKIWEIVDGQQRLTTLYILLKYLNLMLCTT